MTSAPDENLQVGQKIQEKFDFYVLALTFTVLGLGVQTAEFRGNVVADSAELAAWFALLASGFLGMGRIEALPHGHKLYSLKDQYETRAAETKKAKLRGLSRVTSLEDQAEHPIDEVLHNASSSVEKIDAAIKPHEDRLMWQYRWQKRLYLAGFVLLVVARAYTPAVRIVLDVGRLVRGA